ncbi:MAG TPA: hypothetical protein PLU24_03055, partial [Candidatus Omnitrophota bacterium]|nr:hypothetical protein [Candidatus Omnitrophota bacterium]
AFRSLSILRCFAREIFSSGSAGSFFYKISEIALEALPKINELWGISMVELGLFKLKIHPLAIILQTIAIILVLNLISCRKFRNFCKF